MLLSYLKDPPKKKKKNQGCHLFLEVQEPLLISSGVGEMEAASVLASRLDEAILYGMMKVNSLT